MDRKSWEKIDLLQLEAKELAKTMSTDKTPYEAYLAESGFYRVRQVDLEKKRADHIADWAAQLFSRGILFC